MSRPEGDADEWDGGDDADASDDWDDVEHVARPVDPAAAERWSLLKRQAGEALDPIIRRLLDDAGRKSWGRSLFRKRFFIVADLDEATWRAYRYLGSRGEQEHHYCELGVVCHLAPDGTIVGFGVDNGVDFIGLHDVSESGLQRGLEYIRQQRPQVRRHEVPAYDHDRRELRE